MKVFGILFPSDRIACKTFLLVACFFLSIHPSLFSASFFPLYPSKFNFHFIWNSKYRERIRILSINLLVILVVLLVFSVGDMCKCGNGFKLFRNFFSWRTSCRCQFFPYFFPKNYKFILKYIEQSNTCHAFRAF